MGNKIVVTPNDRYGRMVIIKEVEPTKSGKRRVLCKCDCGNTKIVGLTHLRCGETTSCGCYRKEQSSVTHKRHGFGDYRYRLYKIWTGIKERCTNPNSTSYSRYGGRGIKVCPEWENDFEPFREWALSSGYSDKLTIDRIDVNGNYEPSNCRWATNKEQSNNRRTNVLITYQGETHTVSEWSDITGIAYWKIIQRHRVGLPLEQVFFNGDLRLRQTV